MEHSHGGCLETKEDYDKLNEAEPNETKWFDPGNANYKQAVLFVDETQEMRSRQG